MTNKFFSGRKGHYLFCDICGKPCYDFEATKLHQYTGRGGLIVCPLDADVIDFGLVPYVVPPEKSVKWVRINHTDTTNGAAVLDYESTTGLGT